MNNTEGVYFNTTVYFTNFAGHLTWWVCLVGTTLTYNVLKSQCPEGVEKWRQKIPLLRYLLPGPRDVPELLNEVIKKQENLVDEVSEFRGQFRDVPRILGKMLEVMLKEQKKEKRRRPSAPAKKKPRGRPPIFRSLEEERKMERERQRLYRQGKRAGEELETEPEPATPATSSVLSQSSANSSSQTN